MPAPRTGTRRTTRASLAAGAAALLAATGTAQQTSVAQLIERHVTFLGGRAALATAGDFVMEGTIHADPRPLHYRAFVRRSPFAFRQEVSDGSAAPPLVRVTDGRHAWRPGPDGKGQLLSGPEARITLEAAFMDGLRWLEPDQLAGRAGLGPVMTLPQPDGLPPPAI